LIADYWMHEHPSTDTRTRSNVIADYTGLLDAFLRGKIYDIFCKATTVSPDDILGRQDCGGRFASGRLPRGRPLRGGHLEISSAAGQPTPKAGSTGVDPPFLHLGG
jgi:hypothetical protein